MHPGAWMSWVTMVMVVALATTNPFYLVLLLLCVILVATLAPRTGTGVTSFRALFAFAVVMLAFSVLVATINGNYGDHILFTIPGPNVPKWLGGLRLGGPVSAEGLVAASIRGLTILCIFLAFGVFNGAVSPHRVLRTTPGALFHASLVLTVGLTLLPSSIEDLRRIREMRALRGAPPGWRDLPALVVPAVINGLERSMQLAEAMEARGYASGSRPPRSARLAAAASAPLLIAAAWLWFYTDPGQPLGALFAAGGAGCLAWWFFAASRTQRRTSFEEVHLPLSQRIAITLSGLVVVAVLALRFADAASLTYNPFAGLDAPGLSVPGAAVVVLAAWPAIILIFAPSAAAEPDPGRPLYSEVAV